MKKEWDLEKYFYSSIEDENIKKDIEKFKAKSDSFIKKHKGNISKYDESEFLIVLEDLDVLSNDILNVYMFLSLLSSMDVQNQDVQKEIAKVEKVYSDYSEKFIFVTEEIKLCDRLDNVSDMESMSKKFIKRQVVDTKFILDGLKKSKLTATHKEIIKLINKKIKVHS